MPIDEEITSREVAVDSHEAKLDSEESIVIKDCMGIVVGDHATVNYVSHPLEDLVNWLKRHLNLWAGIFAFTCTVFILVLVGHKDLRISNIAIASFMLLLSLILSLYTAFSKIKPEDPLGTGTFRYPDYRAASIMGIGIIIGVIMAVITTWQDPTKQVCNEISIAPKGRRVTMLAPTNENIYEGVEYEVKAPSSTGLQILFHKAQHLIIEGSNEVEVIWGRHFTHYKVQVPAGKSMTLSDGILLGKYDVDAALEHETRVITQRLTFSVVSDQGIYCEVVADDFEAEMIGLAP